ncbi:MAG: fumarylacetoacetate hydrolase family protein [Anaerolineaceae bacterium]|nr:fumarylacetoacetate hydrolase family protein [Anaerolineaceae bacterium]
MRFTRYQKGSDEPRYGWIFEGKIGPLEGNPFSEFRRLDAEIALEEVKLCAPVIPGKIICVARNYVDHALEMGSQVPAIPTLFLKPPSSVIGHGENIILPPQSKQVDHEAELAVVIGKSGRWIQPGDASKYIIGYAAANDVTARDLQRSDGQWGRAKGFDTFCPLGPWIETELSPEDILITCRVNGEMRQMASTRELVFTVPQMIAFASSVMTLNPGDVILTGTPAGVGPLRHGDSVEVEIEGIGTLRNPVVKP